MAGSASNWYKVSSGPLKGQTVYISKAQSGSFTRDGVQARLDAGAAPWLAKANKDLPKGVAKSKATASPAPAKPTKPSKRREFLNVGQAADYAYVITRDWAAKYADAHGESLLDYQNGGYRPLNYALRAGRGDADMYEESVRTRKGLDALFETAPRIPDPITVHRGMLADEFSGKAKELLDSWQVGGEYKDLGYMSTTLDKNVTNEFSYGKGGVDIEVRLPAGQKAIYMQAWEGRHKSFDHEKEILLPRGTRYRVVEKTHDPTLDRHTVVLEVF